MSSKGAEISSFVVILILVTNNGRPFTVPFKHTPKGAPKGVVGQAIHDVKEQGNQLEQI